MNTILLIESHSDMLENLKEAFELEGFIIIASNNGIQGAALAKKHMPSLIISAIQIGILNGYELLHLLINTRKTAAIPFIFSTTQSEKKDKMFAMELGADDYIIKPYKIETLFTMANRLIADGSKRVMKKETAVKIA